MNIFKLKAQKLFILLTFKTVNSHLPVEMETQNHKFDNNKNEGSKSYKIVKEYGKHLTSNKFILKLIGLSATQVLTILSARHV